MAVLLNRPRRSTRPTLYNITNRGLNNNNNHGLPHPHPPHQAPGSSSSLFSRQSLFVLMVGMMLGYLILPILLVQKLGFEDHPGITMPHSIHRKRSFGDYVSTNSHVNDVSGIEQGISSSRMYSNGAPSAVFSRATTGDNGFVGGLLRGGDTNNNNNENDDNHNVNTANKKINNNIPNAYPAVTNYHSSAADTIHASPPDHSDSRKMAIGGSHTPLSETEKRLMEEHALAASQSIPTGTTPYVMKTLSLPDHRRKTVLVTGGAGFVGSHLVDKLMREGHEVIVMDNFFTGQKRNIEHWLHHPNFSLVVHDVTEPIHLEVDEIYHLACPASPPHYQYNPVKTIKTSTMGTINMLGLAKRVKARILLASTSEIYGDPQVHPQHESYWGNVNTIGPRACYDEGKRVAETMMYSYRNQNKVEVRVARIFNTFGPRMHPNDGRVVSNFIIQSLQGKPMTIYGEGKQTRSFQYVSDLVEGLHALMNGDYDMPVNLGNPDEYSVREFAVYIKNLTGSESPIEHLKKSEDDPSQRKPDITTAGRELNWKPRVKVEDGLTETIKYFQRVLEEAGEIIPTGPGASKPEA